MVQTLHRRDGGGVDRKRRSHWRLTSRFPFLVRLRLDVVLQSFGFDGLSDAISPPDDGYQPLVPCAATPKNSPDADLSDPQETKVRPLPFTAETLGHGTRVATGIDGRFKSREDDVKAMSSSQGSRPLRIERDTLGEM
ncbi:MAG: hypothetical protein QXM81_04160, partial [Nitrososphaerota archaeon]